VRDIVRASVTTDTTKTNIQPTLHLNSFDAIRTNAAIPATAAKRPMPFAVTGPKPSIPTLAVNENIAGLPDSIMADHWGRSGPSEKKNVMKIATAQFIVMSKRKSHKQAQMTSGTATKTAAQ